MDLPELKERWWAGELRDGNIYISSAGTLCLPSSDLQASSVHCMAGRMGAAFAFG